MIGRLVVKILGREAGRLGVIVDQVNDNFVIVDGNIKRRRCNLSHLELLDKVLDIKKGASTQEVQEAMKRASLKVTVPRAKKEKTQEKVEKNAKRKK